ncbi:MAG: hypothetical protein WBF13_06950 [Candidatus Zixiibacteriota bacterium]
MAEKEPHQVHGETHQHVPTVSTARLVQTGRLASEKISKGLTKCTIKHGDSGLRDDFGSSFSADLTDAIGSGYSCVNVQLAGWYLDFRSKDHHINTVSIRFKDVSYDPATGGVTWKVEGWYQDKNGDDDYTWRVWWTIFAIA